MSADAVTAILTLHTRISAAGSGKLLLPPATPFVGPVGTIHVKPRNDERTSIQALLYRLTRDYRFRYDRDQLELSYEDSKIVLARVTFLAGA